MTRTALILLLALLGACSSQPVETNYYLLRSDGDMSTRALEPSQDFALGAVTIAPYIDQRGMLMETAEGDLRPARNNLWAEPLYEGVHLYLLSEISILSGIDLLPAAANSSSALINVRIDQLHGTNDGRARLVAYYWLQKQGELIAAYQFAEYKALSADGYAALAEAEKSLLSELAVKIAASVESARSAAE